MTRRSATVPPVVLGLLLWVGLLALAGCGPATSETTEPAAPAVSELRVGLTEWAINTSASTVRPGRVQLVVTNAGGTVHDLKVRGREGEWHTAELRPGAEEVLEVRASAGEVLELWCDVPGHRAQGMSTELRVAQ